VRLLNHLSDGQQELENFVAYLPQGLDHWIVVYEGSFHRDIVLRLKGRLKSAEFFDLEQETGPFIEEIGSSNRNDERVGFLEFVIRYPASIYGGHCPGNDGLDVFISWPQDRVKLCFDVTDNNFNDLFSEAPAEVAARCHKLQGKLAENRSLFYDFGAGAPLSISCANSEWIAYTGFGHNSDYVLPSGEVACVPQSVDGRLPVEGWIIGTMPFGVKYGRIEKGDLELKIEGRQITQVGGANLKLCSDFDGALSAAPGLRTISEVGVGQSLAVRKAAAQHKLGYFWNERNFGLHLGLGAELPVEDNSNRRKTGGHHLDLVLSNGRLTGAKGELLLEWQMPDTLLAAKRE
jgi:hypothetical protein